MLLFGAGAAHAAVAPSPDGAAELFDPGVVAEIDFGMSPGAIQALRAEPDEYVPATLEFRSESGAVGPILVGLRLKGHGSFRPIDGKAAFKVKVDEYVDDQAFLGLEKLTLNNMVQDASMLRETLAYELFRTMGVAAPRTGYAYVRLNGAPYGVYLNVEAPDEVSLPRWFASTQHLYEAETETGLDVDLGNVSEFEVDEGDEEDLSDLEALIAAANDAEGDWSEGMAAVADLSQMTRMWAVERYIGHFDGYSGWFTKNYFLHSDDNGLFSMLPWGTDQTWKEDVGFAEEGGLLFDRCFADASCRALYDGALEEIQQVTTTLELKSKAQRYAALLAPCQALEVEPRREHSAAEIADEVQVVLEFVQGRHISLEDYLGNSQPALAPETADPVTKEPCSSQLSGGGGPPAEPAQTIGEAVPRARIGKTKAKGPKVFTRLAVSGAGTATQTVRAKARDRWKVACHARKPSRAAVSMTVGCRLAGWARNLARSGPLRLKVRVGFHPADARPSFLNRRLTLPRLATCTSPAGRAGCSGDLLPISRRNSPFPTRLSPRSPVDSSWRRARVVVEADGYRFHRGRSGFHHDHHRDLLLREHGFAVLRFDERQIGEEPARVAALVRDAVVPAS